MTKDKSIYIKNIYYMLSYAFQVLKQDNYDEVAHEKFDYVQDLFAAILARGVAQQLKQGLYREYVTKHDTLTVMRGKLDMPETIRNRIQRKQRLACEFDELSENNALNQILKTTINVLMRDKDVAQERKSALRKLWIFFDGVQTIEPSSIHWGRLVYQRNNRNYEMLMNICYFVLDGMLQTTESGEHKIAHFSDDHMARLYEKFILEYYKKHYPQIRTAASQIDWALDDGIGTMLPTMQSDIMLSYKKGDIDKTLIIDAKYYAHTTQVQYDVHTLHSNNLYQIFTYVKNKATKGGEVSGMLLYAKTDEEIYPDNEYQMSGNKIIVKTLDLNCDFETISEQLNFIADSFVLDICVATE